jgi:hypothetical protein
MARKRARDYVPPEVEELLLELSAWGSMLSSVAGGGIAQIKARGRLDDELVMVNELGRLLDSADQVFEALSKVLELVEDDDGGIEADADDGSRRQSTAIGLVEDDGGG